MNIMNDVTYHCVGYGLSAIIIASSSFYEYYFSKGMLKDNPDCTFEQIYEAQHPIARLMMPFGVTGYELACNRFSRARNSPSDDSDISNCFD
jgi:hypothetical protein